MRVRQIPKCSARTTPALTPIKAGAALGPPPTWLKFAPHRGLCVMLRPRSPEGTPPCSQGTSCLAKGMGVSSEISGRWDSGTIGPLPPGWAWGTYGYYLRRDTRGTGGWKLCTYVQSSKATHLGCHICIVYLKRNENFALRATNEECGSFRSITAGGVGIHRGGSGDPGH